MNYDSKEEREETSIEKKEPTSMTSDHNHDGRYANDEPRSARPRMRERRPGGERPDRRSYGPRADEPSSSRGGYNDRGYSSRQPRRTSSFRGRDFEQRDPDQSYGGADSYVNRFRSSQGLEPKAVSEDREQQRPQRRRRVRISEAGASPYQHRSDDRPSDGDQYERRGPRRPYDNRSFDSQYDRSQQGRYTQRGSQRQYNNDDEFFSRQDYDRNDNDYSRSDFREQREYYQNRYNSTRERNRRQYQQRDDSPRRGYNNDNRGGYRSRPAYGRQDGDYDFRRSNNNRRQQRPTQRKFTPRPKPVVYKEEEIDPNATIRLNKYLANTGVCSRREADEMIEKGLIFVNGEKITELGTKITYSDTVTVDGKEVTLENKVYVLLNKPRNCVTTSDDPQERLTVLQLVENACKERIYPVGRLDRNTTGVLLLTNDGDLASKLVHPSFKKKKIYHVWLDKEVSVEDMQRIADGVDLEDGEMHADAISYASEDDMSQVGIEIHSGRNRIVRRLFEHLGYHVRKLDRVYFAGLTKKHLGRGRWRFLTQEEVDMLKMGAFE